MSIENNAVFQNAFQQTLSKMSSAKRAAEDYKAENNTMSYKYKEQYKAILPVIQAWIGGKEIQFDNNGTWRDYKDDEDSLPAFSSLLCEWRIKPETFIVSVELDYEELLSLKFNIWNTKLSSTNPDVLSMCNKVLKATKKH